MTRAPLSHRLRLVVVTDAALARPREVADVARAALAAGAPTLQLRDKESGAGDLLRFARVLVGLTRDAGALLFVNDRFDVALAAGADGVHLGPDDLPVDVVRAASPPGFLIGSSTDDPNEARRLEAQGADYIGCGTVYETASKADAGDVIGLDGLGRVAAAVAIPVLGIGGITVERSAEVATTGAAGVAVISSVMRADDVGAAISGLLAPWVRNR